MAAPPNSRDPNPGQRGPRSWRPPTFIPQDFAPGTEPWWPSSSEPPRGSSALTFARVMLGIQAGLLTLGLVTTPLAFFATPEPQGVSSPYGDLHAPSLTRNIIILVVTLAFAAGAMTTTFRLAPARPRMWWLALVTQAPLTVGYAWVVMQMATAPSPEGMASFAALMFGPVLVAVPVAGVVAFFLPSVCAAAFGRDLSASPR